jgi:hypothetical protein
VAGLPAADCAVGSLLKSKDASAPKADVITVLFVILIVITSAFNSHREISKEFARIVITSDPKDLPIRWLSMCFPNMWRLYSAFSSH